MELTIKSAKLARDLGDERRLRKRFGEQSDTLMIRLAVLEAAPNLAAVPVVKPERCHKMKGDRAGQYAVDLKQPFRLVFEPTPPVPTLDDGGVDVVRVTAITLVEVVDYH